MKVIPLLKEVKPVKALVKPIVVVIGDTKKILTFAHFGVRVNHGTNILLTFIISNSFNVDNLSFVKIETLDSELNEPQYHHVLPKKRNQEFAVEVSGLVYFATTK